MLLPKQFSRCTKIFEQFMWKIQIMSAIRHRFFGFYMYICQCLHIILSFTLSHYIIICEWWGLICACIFIIFLHEGNLCLSLDKISPDIYRWRGSLFYLVVSQLFLIFCVLVEQFITSTSSWCGPIQNSGGFLFPSCFCCLMAWWNKCKSKLLQCFLPLWTCYG